MHNDFLHRVLRADIYDLARWTPLDQMPFLANRLNADIRLKREDLQPVFSFKIRGAYNKIKNLDKEAQRNGVITCSAGNHAQGVALSAHHLGIEATIVMPRTTLDTKVSAVRGWGAHTVLVGDDFDQAYQHTQELLAKSLMTYVPPFDDADVIAGQGTAGMEIVHQHHDPITAIFVPVGGGGLLTGIAAFVKQIYPRTQIIGVEPQDAQSMTLALAAKERVQLDEVGLFADGVAISRVGALPFALAQQYVDKMVTVNNDEICAAVKDIFDDTRALAEPSGALGVAGIKKYLEEHALDAKGTYIAVLSGANTNFDRLRYIAERTEIGEKREAIFAVTIPEHPGSFREFCRIIGTQCVISEFNYRYQNQKQAHIFVGIKIQNPQQAKEIYERLCQHRYAVVDMTHNETAKMHVRHMIGGSPRTTEELLYRFEFPERPGALGDFLNALDPRWNISLFHYRNHGAARSSVLVGLQIPGGECAALQQTLQNLHYPFHAEGDNPAFQIFLHNPDASDP